MKKPISFRIHLAISAIALPAATILSLAPVTATAQVTTSRLRGVVTDAVGDPLVGATVVIDHSGGKIKKTAITNDNGSFSFTGLIVGGPYNLQVSSPGKVTGKQSGLSLKAGSNPLLNLSLSDQAVERIEVSGARVSPSLRGTLFDTQDIDNTPSQTGDLKDIIRRDPNAYVEGNSLFIGGNNNRFNSVTIDGIRQDDDFGLNASGYPTQRSPIALKTIEELSVNQSPFDVRYGNFLGGNVNVVTKSGTNDVEGSVYIAHKNDKWVGKKTKDQSVASDFDLSRMGFTLGGPILEDKLHYFVAVEGLRSSSPSRSGVSGSGADLEAEEVFASDVLTVQQISRDVYGFDAGTVGQPLEENDLKFLAKIDYQINDDHRLETKYQRSAGNNINATGVRDDRLPLTSNWYERKDSLETLSLRLFSDVTENLSTKLEASIKKVKTRQDPLNGNGFMQADVTTPNGATVRIGPDEFRHANELDNDTIHFAAEGNYLLGSHLITAAIEHDQYDINNLFGPTSNGVATYDSFEDFAAREPSELEYQNAVTNNIDDVRAKWGYDVTTLMLQDEYQITDAVVTRYGVRAETYSSRGSIAYNQNFSDRYGFSNTSDLDGKQNILPRFDITYQPSRKISLKTGMGLFGGGTPNVWISNNYSNDGITSNDVSTDSASGFDGRNIPEDLANQLQAGDGSTNALDPDFKLPQSFKFNTSAMYNFDLRSLGKNYQLEFNYTYSKVKHGLLWKDLARNLDSVDNNQPNAVGPDGRAIYDTTPEDSDDEGSFNSSRRTDMLMTNTDKGFGHTASVKLSKRFESGFNITGSYAWQRVQDIIPGNSSRAVSNYGQVAVGRDPNNPDLATSNYERKHRFMITADYSKDFIGDLLTTVSLFLERRSGQPYSYTFGGNSRNLSRLFGEPSEFSRRNRMLLYVPKGDGSDVIYADGFDVDEFNAYLAKNGLDKYRGKIAPRNAFSGDWTDNMDLRLSQELPAYNDDHRARFVLDIENVPNLLNKKWGQVRNPDFPYTKNIVDVSYDQTTGKYIYSNLDTSPDDVNSLQSVWQMSMALYYYF
ncbi:MAG: TonB-dependent receptor [Pseudobacteriovorax sp.]|nr:TonB-dependent receptor [Pseudobacteriovorax sp.]